MRVWLTGRCKQQRNCLLIVGRQVLSQGLRYVTPARHELQRLVAIRGLHESAKRIEAGFVPNDQFEALIEKEWRETRLFGGRTVMDDARERKAGGGQLRLF